MLRPGSQKADAATLGTWPVGHVTEMSAGLRDALQRDGIARRDPRVGLRLGRDFLLDGVGDRFGSQIEDERFAVRRRPARLRDRADRRRS
jgi:hypothetical protein